ncbi:hypothetical protein R11007_02835 [Ralstonia holmesii]|nr:hypothetical protein R11007_02835 [Ralstonia sp. LMG 32967]
MKYLTTATLTGEAGAILSDCEQYRYRLWREWERSLPVLGFIMLNPSTADHLENDRTITRCIGRAVAGGYGRLEVVNLFRCARQIPTPCSPIHLRLVMRPKLTAPFSKLQATAAC